MHLKHISGLSVSASCYLFPPLAFFLSGFTDQRREQLHQHRSGGVEMQRWVAVGKHLALRLQEAGQGGGQESGSRGVGGEVVNRCAEDGLCRLC